MVKYNSVMTGRRKGKKLGMSIILSSEDDEFGGLDIRVDTGTIHPAEIRNLIDKALSATPGVVVDSNYR